MKKRLTSLILVCILLLTAAACKEKSDEPKDTFLPCGLSFGMSYDDFCAALTEKGIDPPEIEEARANTGFASAAVHVNDIEGEFDWSFMHSDMLANKWASEDLDTLFTFPALYFSFNDAKELYQIVCFFEDLETVNDFGSELTGYLDGRFGKGQIDNSDGDASVTSYLSGDYEISLTYDSGDDQFIYNVICSKYNTVSPK